MIKSYRDLIVWQKSVDFVIEIYKLTKQFPKEEIYGLTSQIRRASVSIPSNIAEGFSRKHRREYSQFIRMAFASGAEVETQMIIAKKLGYASVSLYKKADDLLVEIMKMLNSLNSALVAKP
jgi:four helix bundle protein